MLIIHYYLEPLRGNRAQLHVDYADKHGLLISGPVGSPAPIETVRQHERKIVLP